jgi:hypothetical protein
MFFMDQKKTNKKTQWLPNTGNTGIIEQMPKLYEDVNWHEQLHLFV